MTTLRLSTLALLSSVLLACSDPGAARSEKTGVERSPLTTAVRTYMHAGGTLDAAAPTAETAAVADSPMMTFLPFENPWVEVGTWSAAPSQTTGTITAGNASLWLGLVGRSDRGVNFDVRVEIAKNGSPLAAYEKLCIQGLTEDPALATRLSVPFGAPGGGAFDGSSDALSLTFSARIGTDGNGALCDGERRHARGLRFYYDGASQASSLALSFSTPVAQQWIVMSCFFIAPSPAGMSSWIDSDGGYYVLRGNWWSAPRAGSLNYPSGVPTLRLGSQALLDLLLAAQTLDTSTAGYTTVTGPMRHPTMHQGVLDSAGAPGVDISVDEWRDGPPFNQETLKTSNDPAAAVIRQYSCFIPD